MDRVASRRVAEQHAVAAGGGPVLALPLPGGATTRRDTRPLPDRIVDRMLSRRRRFEFLEGMLTYSFPNQYPLSKRRTNLTNVMLAKYEELAEVGPMYFEGEHGADELYETYVWLRAISDQVVQRHSLAQWLLLTRRILFAPFDGHRLPPRLFVESLLRRSRAHDASRRVHKLQGRQFRVSPRTLEDVHDLLLVATTMWHVGQSYRTLCKGLVVTIGHPITFVGVSYATDPEVVSAIGLFEARQRAPRTQRLRPSVGLQGPDFGARRDMWTSGQVIPGWVHHDPGQDQQRHVLRWRTYYRPETFSTTDVLAPVGDGDVPTTRSNASAAVLWACWRAANLSGVPFVLPKGPWNHWGVAILSAHELTDGLRRWTPLATRFDPSWTPTLGLDALTRRSVGDEWEDREPAIVAPMAPDLFLVDLLAATEALFEAHIRPAGGGATQGWTDLFEDQVQSVLDTSQWSPPHVLRRFRKRTIRRPDGSAITDIDALGFHDGVLLLVDAKAWTTNARLRHGEYGAVRTRGATIEAAAAAWTEKTKELRDALAGRLDDPSLVRKIVGVVACPDVPYVLPGHCTAEVLPALRMVSTLSELGKFAGAPGFVEPPPGLIQRTRWLRKLP